MRADTMYGDTTDRVPSALLKWSAVFGGLVLGLAMLLLLSAMWLALAYGSEVSAIRDNLRWYIGISAVASLFVAGIITGYLSGVRGVGPGMLHGFTLWGLLMLVAVTVGVPSLLNVFGLQGLADQANSATRLVGLRQRRNPVGDVLDVARRVHRRGHRRHDRWRVHPCRGHRRRRSWCATRPTRSATPARSDERVFVDDDATTRM